MIFTPWSKMTMHWISETMSQIKHFLLWIMSVRYLVSATGKLTSMLYSKRLSAVLASILSQTTTRGWWGTEVRSLKWVHRKLLTLLCYLSNLGCHKHISQLGADRNCLVSIWGLTSTNIWRNCLLGRGLIRPTQVQNLSISQSLTVSQKKFSNFGLDWSINTSVIFMGEEERREIAYNLTSLGSLN